MSKITWSTDVNTPCCPGEIIGPHGESILVQTDWDYPSIARTFGWDMREVQREAREERMEDARAVLHETKETASRVINALSPEYATAYADVIAARRAFTVAAANLACEHPHTDGTVRCPDCGISQSDFISAAYDWLVTNDGATAEDPGYF